MEIFGKLFMLLGWQGYLIFLAVTVAAVGIIQLLRGMKLRAPQVSPASQSDPELRYHVLFANAQYRLNVEIPSLDLFIDKPVRQQLMTDLLRIYVHALATACKEISEIDTSTWSSEKWTTETSTRLSNALIHASITARTEGIPDIVSHRFTRWAQPSFDMLFSYIEQIGASNAYPSNVIKSSTLFLIVNLLLTTITGDAERTIQMLNGDITGLMYKGRMIEPIEH